MLISTGLLLLNEEEEVQVRVEDPRKKEDIIEDSKVKGELHVGSVENHGISKNIATHRNRDKMMIRIRKRPITKILRRLSHMIV